MLMADADAFPSSFFYPNAPRGGAGSLVFLKNLSLPSKPP